MTNIYYKSTYRTTMTNNINIMQWICTGNYSMTSDESVAHINIVFNTKYHYCPVKAGKSVFEIVET